MLLSLTQTWMLNTQGWWAPVPRNGTATTMA